MPTKFQGKFPLIGIHACAQSGKSTAAKVLKGLLSYQETSFAEPIRQFVSDLTGISREELEDAAIKEAVIPWIGKSPRQMMQTLGTEWGRQLVCEDFWVQRAINEVKRLEALGQHCLISDVRFENEAEVIRKAGGVVLHLVRPDALVVSSHVSEVGVARASDDYVIFNDGTLSQFKAQVANWHYAMWKGDDKALRAFQCP